LGADEVNIGLFHGGFGQSRRKRTKPSGAGAHERFAGRSAPKPSALPEAGRRLSAEERVELRRQVLQVSKSASKT
jgi:hypothetical protein